jgi:hypothetical protein
MLIDRKFLRTKPILTFETITSYEGPDFVDKNKAVGILKKRKERKPHLSEKGKISRDF